MNREAQQGCQRQRNGINEKFHSLSMHQKQPPANVAIAFSLILSKASVVIVNSKCKNGYKNELTS
jgi:hypothetical protein